MYFTRFGGPAKSKTLIFPIVKKVSNSSSLLVPLGACWCVLQRLDTKRFPPLGLPPNLSNQQSAISNQILAAESDQSQGYWQLIRDTGWLVWEIGLVLGEIGSWYWN